MAVRTHQVNAGYIAYQTNQPVNVANEVFWRKDGVAIPVEYWSHPIEKNGVVIGSIATFIDITQRKRAEETLLKLSSAVEQTEDSIIITDRNGTIEYVNHAFEVLTGISGSSKRWVKLPEILKSGTRDQKYYEAMWKTILSGKVFSDVVVNKKEKTVICLMRKKTISPIFDKNKTITHFVRHRSGYYQAQTCWRRSH